MEDKVIKVLKGNSFTLDLTHTEIQTDDRITVSFGDTVIAEINGWIDEMCTNDDDDNDQRFRHRLGLYKHSASQTITNSRFADRLQMDKSSRSLIITDSKSTDSGEYHLVITRSGADRRFKQIIEVIGE